MSIKKIPRCALSWLQVVLVLVLVSSCASSKQQPEVSAQEQAVVAWNKTVKKTIPDEQRAKELMVLGEQMIAMQQKLMDDLIYLNKQAGQYFLSYHTEKADVDRLYSEFTQKKNALIEQYRDILFAMREQTSEKEWKELIN